MRIAKPRYIVSAFSPSLYLLRPISLMVLLILKLFAHACTKSTRPWRTPRLIRLTRVLTAPDPPK